MKACFGFAFVLAMTFFLPGYPARAKSFIGMELLFPTGSFRTSQLRNGVGDLAATFGRGLTVRVETLPFVYGSVSFNELDSSTFGYYAMSLGVDYLWGDKLFLSPGLRLDLNNAYANGGGTDLGQDLQSGNFYRQSGVFYVPRVSLGVMVDTLQFFIFYQMSKRLIGPGSLSAFENSFAGFGLTTAL